MPERIERCSERWNLRLGHRFDLSYNYAAPAARKAAGGQAAKVVLKLGFPCPEFSSEIAALRHFQGRGAARLIDADANEGAILLERLTPGRTLDRALTNDEAAAAAAARIMRQLWRLAPPGHEFPILTDWFAGFARHRDRSNGASDPIPETLLIRAESLAGDLISSAPAQMLLHGDLHHGNILTAGRADYLAIDPKGVIGDPAFEPSAFFLNPRPVSLEATKRRLDIFAEILILDRERIRGWGIARAILSACWTLEDNGDEYAPAIAVAEQLIAAS